MQPTGVKEAWAIEIDEFFVQYQHQLLDWATNITWNSDINPEDLVQEAYLQLRCRKDDSIEILNTGGYNHRALKFIFYGWNRKVKRRKALPIDAVDYDILDLLLLTSSKISGLKEQEKIYDRVVASCQYACLRKNTSRIGSILLFALIGFSPVQSGLLIGRPRHVVDNELFEARKEADLFYEDPTQFKFYNNARRNRKAEDYRFSQEANLYTALKRYLTFYQDGDCLSSKRIEALYKDGSTIPSNILSHLVSCPDCLEKVALFLGIDFINVIGIHNYTTTKVKKKMKNDSDKNDKHDGGAGSNGAGGGGGFIDLNKYHQRFRQFYEHRPQELILYLGDTLLTTLQVKSVENTVKLTIPSGLGECIYVLSNHGYTLLMVDITKNFDESMEEKIYLSDNRTLTVNFTPKFGTLDLCYTDPLVIFNDFVDEEIFEEESLPTKIKSLIKDSWNDYKYQYEKRQRETKEQKQDREGVTLFNSFNRRKTIKLNNYWRFAPIATTVTVVAVIICFFMFTNLRSIKVTAKEIRARASNEEKVSMDIYFKSLRAVFKKVMIEERSISERKIFSRYSIEVWRRKELEVKRLFGTGNDPIVGEWKDASGTSVIYRSGAEIDTANQNCITLNNIWRLDVTIGGFESLFENDESIELIEDNPNAYILRGKSGLFGNGVKILDATLTLSKGNLRPIEQVLLIQTSDSVLREIKFTVSEFEPIDEKKASSNFIIDPVFQPEIITPVHELPNQSVGQTLDVPKVSLSQNELAVIKIDILSRLIASNIKNETDIKITSDGYVVVDSNVATKDDKKEVLRILSFPMSNPFVKLNIRSDEEELAKLRSLSLPGQSVILYPTIDQHFVYDELHSFFVAELRTKDDKLIKKSIDQYIEKVTTNAENLVTHSRELKKVAGGFSNEQLGSLTVAERLNFSRLVNSHLQKYSETFNSLYSALSPVFLSNSQIDSSETITVDISERESLTKVTNQLTTLSFEIYKDTSSSFGAKVEDEEDDLKIYSKKYIQNLKEIKKLIKALDIAFK